MSRYVPPHTIPQTHVSMFASSTAAAGTCLYTCLYRCLYTCLYTCICTCVCTQGEGWRLRQSKLFSMNFGSGDAVQVMIVTKIFITIVGIAVGPN